MEYYKVYFQVESAARVVETIEDYGLYCMEMPFTIATSAKELTKRDWHDEDGVDIYVPKDGLRLASYDMEVKFGFKGDKFAANDNINAFLTFVKQGMLKVYCDYTKIGRQHVVFSKLSDNATLVREDDGGDLLIVKMTFTVCDPVTNVEPEISAGSILSLKAN